MTDRTRILLGAIADDMTGATDLALMLAKGGMRTVQVIGPENIGLAGDADAVVVAMKSRSNPADEAVAMSLQAADALLHAGAQQLLFKYCSTFDSTDRGNIGPVADALLERTAAPIAIACPAFPATGRTLYQGHLFVNGRLLNESGMQNHPLNPMTDPDLVRVLSRQSTHKVGLVPLDVVRSGPDAIAARLASLIVNGCRLAIVDAVEDEDLRRIGETLRGAALITGGSGIALGLPDNFRSSGDLAVSGGAEAVTGSGRAAILSGSCSVATNEQVARAKAAGIPAFRITPAEIADPAETAREAMAWAADQDPGHPVLIYATDSPENVEAVQARLGREQAGALVEQSFGHVARGMADDGYGTIVVAGGETSGAVIQALGVGALRIGPEIAPGVPWTTAIGDRPLALALKSGNFGGPDFFRDALAMLDR